jgi:tRNA nucleotidyltransferase (CCA-adding enzyme)
LYAWCEIIATMVLYDETIDIDQWIKEWKLSNKIKRDSQQLVEATTYYFSNNLDFWLIYNLPDYLEQNFVRVISNFHDNSEVSVERIKQLREIVPIRTRADLQISGADLISLYPNKPKGPWINFYLQEIEKNIVIGKLNNEQNAIRKWLIEWTPQESD